MNKKTLILLITAVVLLAGGIAYAIAKLYADHEGPGEPVPAGRFEERHPLVRAVPSDAVLVFCTKDFGRLRKYLDDSTAVFSELVRGKLDAIMDGCGRFSKAPALLSLNYAKELQPLLAVSVGTSVRDTAVLHALVDTALAAGLSARVHDGLFLVSNSQTVLSSSVRHIDQGDSILEAKGFAPLAGQTAGEDLLFISNNYMDVLQRTYFAGKHRAAAQFLSRMASWTAFSVQKRSDAGSRLTASLLYGEDPAFYAGVLAQAGEGEIMVQDVLPSGVDYVFDLPVADIDAYIKAWRRYMDARIKLDAYRAALDAQKKLTGTQAEEWAKSLAVSEVALAGVHIGKELKKVLLVRSGARKKGVSEPASFPYGGFVSTLFGDLFTPDGEDTCLSLGSWTVIGSAAVIDAWRQEGFAAQTLKTYLDECDLSGRIPAKGCRFFLYHSLTEDPTVADATFSAPTAKAVRASLAGVTYAPLFLSASAEGGRLDADISIDRLNTVPGKKQAETDYDTSVVVPDGPFPVKNSATGQTNKLYQNAHLSICLQDENGKDLWGIPFKEKIAGTVEDIDYFANGKIQFLFGAGSKLYLLDRLGRFVGGFPVELGKQITLGPAVYDFTGAHGYTAVVLHADNTVGMYDLHGKTAADWKGFTVNETIKSLPELLESGGSKYWIVRTSRQTLCFPFKGGESLWNNTGGKMVRPDSPVEPSGKNSVKAKCYDGKERSFKLE